METYTIPTPSSVDSATPRRRPGINRELAAPISSSPSSSAVTSEIMSNIQQSFNAGKARGTGEEKTGQLMDSAKNAASTVTQSAQGDTEKASSFLHQTGEQAKNMAQGAMDTLKNNTPGMDKSNCGK